jgi:hypothetical protein
MDRIATTDRELVEASRRGELDAFGHLVARYRDLVSQDRDVLLDTALTVPQFIAFASSGMLKVDVD